MGEELHVLLAATSAEEADTVEQVLRARWSKAVLHSVKTPEDLHRAVKNDRWDLLVIGGNAPAMAIEAIKEAGWNRLLIAIAGTDESGEALDLLQSGVRAVVPKAGIKEIVPIIAHEVGVQRDRRLRRLSDKMLARSEARYRRLFEASQDGILVIEAASGVVTEANRAVLTFLGHPAHSVIGRVAWDDARLAPLVGERDVLAHLPADGRLQRDSVPLRTADGRTVWADVIASCHDIDGERVFQFNIRDVTDRKLSEEGLSRANRALRTLSRANESLIHAQSEAQLVEDACRIVVKVGGFRLAWVAYADAAAEPGVRVVAHHGHRDVIGSAATPIWPLTREQVDAALTAGPQAVTLADGMRCRSALVLPLRHSDTVFGVVTIVAEEDGAFDVRTRDVLQELAGDLAYGIRSQRERALYVKTEEALRSSETRFRTMAETASDALIVIDSDGRITFWNNAAAQIFGYAEEEALGRNMHALLASPEDAERHRCAMETFVRSGQGLAVGRRMELTAYRKGGEAFPVELTLSASRMDGGWQALGIVRDVSERKLMEERLHQADKMDALGNLAGGIAHDLKNMLFPVLSLIGLTIKELPPDSRQRARLEKVLQATERARALVERIHAFSHRDPVSRSPMNMAQAVGEALALIRPMLPKSIDLVERWRYRADTCVLMDASQFDAVLMNFASNAADAMEGRNGTLTVNGGEVEADAEELVPTPGPYVWLSFTDTGVGMSPGLQARIFEPWFSTKGKGKGTGLGLAMVKKIVTENGGAVTVTSQPGQGATFTIYLPQITRA